MASFFFEKKSLFLNPFISDPLFLIKRITPDWDFVKQLNY